MPAVLVAALLMSSCWPVVRGDAGVSERLLPGPDNWGDLPDATYEVYGRLHLANLSPNYPHCVPHASTQGAKPVTQLSNVLLQAMSRESVSWRALIFETLVHIRAQVIYDREVVSTVPQDGEPKGVLFSLHGCLQLATEWGFQSDTCPNCHGAAQPLLQPATQPAKHLLPATAQCCHLAV